MTASQNHTQRASKPVTKTMVQRSQTYDIFTEPYHTSVRQQEVRREQTWNLKARLQFTASSKHPRLSQNISMELLRGTESRNLRDGTPNPAYIVEEELLR